VGNIVSGNNLIEFRYPTRPSMATWQWNGFNVKDVEIQIDPVGGAYSTPYATPYNTPYVTPTYATPYTTPPTPGSGTIDFNDRSPGALSGDYPAGVANWGAGWIVSAPFGGFGTNSSSFSGAAITQASFTFSSARRLVSLQASNGESASSTISISCSGNTTKTQAVAPGATVTITTGWTNNCTTVTIASSNSWNTNFDNIIYDTAGGTPPPKPGDINGDGQVNIIDLSALLSAWGSNNAVADLNDDGTVNILDLSSLLSLWGS
jgi:hypothetical protein